MKRYRLLLIFMLLPILAWGEKVIYVFPQGRDIADGSKTQPVATISQALKLARQLRTDKTLDEPIVIQLNDGIWQLRKPLVLTRDDSGTKQSPLIIRGNHAVISGGRTVTGFREIENGLWSIDLSDYQPIGTEVPQLFVNGKRAICARTPNELEFFPTGKAQEWLIDSVPERSSNRNGLAAEKVKMPAEAVAAMQKVKDLSGVTVSFLHAWDITRRHVQSFSVADSALFITGARMKSWNPIDRASQFFLENDITFLDVPGEYYMDTKQNILYYKPRKGEVANSATATIPMIEQLLLIEGDEKGDVSNICFEGITFSHTRYVMPLAGDNPNQAASQLNAAISANFASYINFKNCEVSQTANWAIAWLQACRNNTVEHCYLHDLGAGGIMIGTKVVPTDEERMLTRYTHIENNILREGGRIFPTGVGIILFQTSDNQVVHNDISDFYYTGVSVGWVWGYAYSPSQRNIINYNHIHHIGWGVLSDMGGVYTLGFSKGTEVSHNYIHDIYSYGYGGWGLYTDEGSTGVHMEQNLVCRCKSSGFHQHYGKENVIRNNVFVDNIKAQLEATRTEPDHLPFTFSNNIILYREGNMYGINWNEVNANVDGNIYWNTNGSVDWNGLNLTQWQKKTNKDKHSLVVDPQLRNIEEGDYQPQNKSALRKIHFQLFDYAQAGVTGDNAWKKLAQFDPNRDALYQRIVEELKRK